MSFLRSATFLNARLTAHLRPSVTDHLRWIERAGRFKASPDFLAADVRSNGSGTVSLRLNQKAGTIEYVLSYSDVGTTPPKTGTVSLTVYHRGPPEPLAH